ncbi:flagellar brake protein [Inmirania thermothiophila]|uniref:PilZ domain-containing protein n=1 Tax=Inmirania thermothiophila TaxID=1750597 RepID=A0A3N1XX97_9GAMM|nr:flagellar brake protein [Inmirania thermothiophila]ROR29832.1 PilZ domain-containing protein [Inmirania thermothiophila]
MGADLVDRPDVAVQLSPEAGETLPIGIGTPLQVEVKGLAAHLRSRAVGMVPGECVILTEPVLPAGHGPLRAGQELIVRYLYEGTVFAFPGTILAVVPRPLRMLVTTYPKVVAKHRLRADDRVGCRLPGSLVLPDGARVEVIVVDLSRGGCRCLTRAEAPELEPARGEDARLELALPGAAEALAVRCRLRKTEPVADGLALGLRFDPDDVDAQGRLVDFLEALAPPR